MGAFTRLAAIACVCVGVIALLGPAAAPAANTRTRVGTASALPLGAHIAGALPADAPLRLTIALQPRDPAALRAFATAVSTPGSPDYRDYVDAGAVRAALRRHARRGPGGRGRPSEPTG